MGEWIFELILNTLDGIFEYTDKPDGCFGRFFRTLAIVIGFFSAIILFILFLCWIF